MNQAQQLLVYDEIEKRKRAHPAIAEFFSENRDEPFFVKNLENVQGDERDVIVLTVNYATNAGGSLSHNFGPLNHAGGERRLNVAVTRAKHELIVVSSITSSDIDLSRTAAKGAVLLRAYLDFAERGPAALEREVEEDAPRDHDSEFEVQVARALQAAGLDVRKQVGCGGFRIDLALVDPERPGRYVLGIECDGATYHSSATARDRDRLRQEVLESLGWTICRIWSTDWVRDPRRQVARVLEAFDRARNTSPIDEKTPPRASEPQRRTPTTTNENGNGKDSGSHPQQFNFSDIDDVPSDLVDQLLVEVLGQNGATPTDDLTRATARRLGFTRTGNKISQRLEQRIKSLRCKAIIDADEEGRLFRPARPTQA
jgi:very-short-patch-repair endonuclease